MENLRAFRVLSGEIASLAVHSRKVRHMPFEFARYLNIRSAHLPGWLAGGGRFAFLTDITGTPQVWAVDVVGGWPDQLTFFADKVWLLSPSPGGDRLVCARDIGGNENYQLYLVSADGETVRRLTHDDAALNNFGGWSHDGQRIAYASNTRDGTNLDIYVLAVDGGEPELVYQADGRFGVLGWSPDDTQLLLMQGISSAHQPLYLLDLISRSLRPLTPAGAPVRDGADGYVCWASDGTVYLLTDRDRDFVGVARLDLATGETTYLTDQPWDVTALAVSSDARMLAYTVNLDGYNRLHLHDIDSGQVTPVTDLPDGVVAEPTFSPDGAFVALSAQSPRHNLDIWVVEVTTLACQQVTRSSLAGIPQAGLAAPELIHYETFDKRSIPAFLFRPPRGMAPFPVILYVHGGPASQLLPEFDPRFQYFLNRGYAILATNVRGSTGYGKAYMALDDVRLRMDSVADLKYAVQWLRASGEVDPNRIAIYGRSYGGFMVLAALTTYPELWAAAIDVVGIGNWVTFLENTASWRRSHREQEYGSLAHDREFLAQISPTHKIDRIQAPMLVIHGANDPRVPITEADQIVAGLGDRGHPVEYLRYEDEGHKISKLANRIDSFTKMADFLDRYLA